MSHLQKRLYLAAGLAAMGEYVLMTLPVRNHGLVIGYLLMQMAWPTLCFMVAVVDQ